MTKIAFLKINISNNTKCLNLNKKYFIMDLQTRKIEFVQAFLKIQSEEVISQFESLLNNKSTSSRMSLKELNSRIDRSEQDFKHGKHKTTSELLDKYS